MDITAYPVQDLSTALAHRLLELCQAKQWTLNELANAAQVPLTTLKNILNGSSRNPGVITIAKLCQGLGISLAEFFQSPLFQTAYSQS